MKICLNSEDRETTAETAAGLLLELKLHPAQVAVEHNGTVLFRHELEKTLLREGDRLEIIRVTAGG